MRAGACEAAVGEHQGGHLPPSETWISVGSKACRYSAAGGGWGGLGLGGVGRGMGRGGVGWGEVGWGGMGRGMGEKLAGLI